MFDSHLMYKKIQLGTTVCNGRFENAFKLTFGFIIVTMYKTTTKYKINLGLGNAISKQYLLENHLKSILK